MLQCRSSASAMPSLEPLWQRTYGQAISPENWHLSPPVPLRDSATSDRMEFLGKYGSVFNPLGLKRTKLAGRFGSLQDPCAAATVDISLAPGERKEIIFVLGQADGLDEIRGLVRKYADSLQARESSCCCFRSVGRHSKHHTGLDTGYRPEFDDESLAVIPSLGLSCLGTHFQLSVWRGLRVQRPASGRDGAGLLRA